MRSKAPTFKVVIKNSKASTKRRKKNSILSQKKSMSEKPSGYRKHEGVNLYMSISKPTSIPDPPKNLLKFLKQKVSLMSKKERLCAVENQQKSYEPRKKLSNKPINDFIAFRTYYSRALKGVVSQTDLSSIISRHWTIDYNTRRTWELIAQEYNCNSENISFYEWLKVKYSVTNDWVYEILGTDWKDHEQYCSKKQQQPYIENVYMTQLTQGFINSQKLDFSVEPSLAFGDWLEDPSLGGFDTLVSTHDPLFHSIGENFSIANMI